MAIASAFPDPTIDLDNGPYWEYTKQGELRYQFCLDGDGFWFPVGPVCPRCLGTNFEWRQVSLEGELQAAITYRRAFVRDAEIPYTVGHALLPEGIRLSGQLDPGDEDVAKPPRDGARVRVVFEQRTSGYFIPRLELIR